MTKPEADDLFQRENDLGFNIMRGILRRHKKEDPREVLLAPPLCSNGWSSG